MTVDTVKLVNFRSYRDAEAGFSAGINVITGRNGQGKTNLLEAIWLLTGARPFRARSDRELIMFGELSARVYAEAASGGREHRIDMTLSAGRARKISVNGVRLKSASALSGRMRAVLFSPDDLYMIKEGAQQRRRQMDHCLCQLRPRYAAIRAAYSNVYEQKMRILRDFEQKPSLLELLDDYSYRLAELSAELIHYRAALIREMSPVAAAVHREFSGGREELSLEYATVKTIEDPLAPARELVGPILEHQRAHRQAEIDARTCLTGAHKDDFTVSINGQSAKLFASQGQTRTAALSIKLAEREMHIMDGGEPPVLLLDDVLSELDSGRRDFVLNRIGGGQVFITCCEDGDVSGLTGGSVFRVAEGRIERCTSI